MGGGARGGMRGSIGQAVCVVHEEDAGMHVPLSKRNVRYHPGSFKDEKEDEQRRQGEREQTPLDVHSGGAERNEHGLVHFNKNVTDSVIIGGCHHPHHHSDPHTHTDPDVLIRDLHQCMRQAIAMAANARAYCGPSLVIPDSSAGTILRSPFRFDEMPSRRIWNLYLQDIGGSRATA